MDKKTEKKANPDFVTSLARGLSVIQAFGPNHPQMTLSEVAQSVGLTRAAARRFLLTLTELGFANFDGKYFKLTPRVLSLGHAFLSSLQFSDLAKGYLEKITSELGESSSIAVLDETEIVYVARSAAPHRLMSVRIDVGTRLPVHATSMGQILLTGLDSKCFDLFLAGYQFRKITDKTITTPEALKERIELVRKQKFALVDQELEEGLRSLAVPIIDPLGNPIAALNISAHAMRLSKSKLRREILPVLQSAASEIGAAIGGSPQL